MIWRVCNTANLSIEIQKLIEIKENAKIV